MRSTLPCSWPPPVSTSTLTYDSTANPLVGPVAQHIFTAQTATQANGGLITRWGVPPSVNDDGAALHRDMNQAEILPDGTASWSL